MKGDIIKWNVVFLLALIGANIWIFNTNCIVLIPIFALCVGKGRSETIVFSFMSIIATLLYGEMYSLILILAYIIYLIVYKMSLIIFLDEIDCGVVASFVTVFVLCVEKDADLMNLSRAFVCLGYALISFWLYYILYVIDDCFALKFSKKQYKLEIKIFQSSKDPRFCGDCYDYFSNGDRRYLVLSDGMFVGKEAYDISSLAISYIRNSIESGESVDDSVRRCSNVIGEKYFCEKFSTLDLLELNNSKLSIFKRGAEESLLIRKDNVVRINSNSLPLGVDGDSNVNYVNVKDDDILLMYSDGLKEKYPLFENMIKDRIYGHNLCGWLEKLMKKNLDEQKDDVSILVIKFVDIS